MALRTRLVLTTVALLAIALFLVAGATFGALQDWLQTAREAAGALRSAREAPGTPPAAREVPGAASDALMAASGELSARIASVLAGTSAATLLCLTLLAAHLVRRGLRPLDRIVEAAADIGAGDLERRVDAAPPGTEVGRLGHALNAMLAQLQSAFREREESEGRLRRFVADASHELRTPVATIRGYAELFRRGAHSRPEDLARAMERIESEAARMGLLVEELLTLTRLDAGRPLERTTVDLTALAADAITDLLAIAPGRPLSLEHPNAATVPGDPATPNGCRAVMGAPAAPEGAQAAMGNPEAVEAVTVPGDPEAVEAVTVLGDPAALRQVAGNLLTNVLDHTPPGTPAVVRVRVEGSYAVLEVADEGPGIGADQAERVFERFYRGNRQGAGRRGGGSGLGLAIVAAVVTAHGGDVRVVPGTGATIQVRLPRTGPP